MAFLRHIETQKGKINYNLFYNYIIDNLLLRIYFKNFIQKMCYKLKLSIIFALDLRNRLKNKQT